MAIGVYQILNKVSGKSYIGSTTRSFSSRWNKHASELRRGIHPNQHLQNAFNKYGVEALQFIILESSENLEDVILWEQAYIDEIRPEYNIRKIAESNHGLSPTAETRRKISEASSGRAFLDETRQKISEAMKGNKHGLGHRRSEEQRRKLSEAKRGNASRLGMAHSEETRRRISEAQKGRPRKGTSHSKEWKDKISAAIKIHWQKRRGLKGAVSDEGTTVGAKQSYTAATE